MGTLQRLGAAAAGLAMCLTAVNAAPAQASTKWDCVTYDSLLFDMAGICGELNYSVVKRNGKCKVRSDKILVYGVGGRDEFENNPAIRLYSLDLQSGSQRFLFTRDDVVMKNKTSGPHKKWDPKGGWTSREQVLTVHYKLYMLGIRPDKIGLLRFTVGPFKKC